jgi:HAD superfamily hydrolase (TIGR01509 family)
LSRAQGRAGTHPEATLDPRQLWVAIEADPRWRDWQEGRMSPHQWYEHLTGRLGLSLSFEDFCASWNRALDPEPILDDLLFVDLGARYRLGLLSNTDPLHAAHIDHSYRFPQHFSTRIYSCRVGVSKPAPAIYQAALDGIGLTAPEALYIDDVQEYVDAAQKLGLAAIHFQDPLQLLAELNSRKLLSD